MDKKWIILSAVACGTFMATLDSSIVNVALPSITKAFHTGITYSRWVVISYLFSITGLLLLFGKLADQLGRKPIFLLGFFFFILGSLLCGLANSIERLILARSLQGFGAAMLMANGPAIITAAFPKNERGKALGTLAMVVSAGLALGPTLGGFLVRYFSWPSIFFVNIPFGILGITLVSRFIPGTIGTMGADLEIFEREKKLPFTVQLQVIFSKLRYFDWLGAFLWMFLQLGYTLALDHQNVLGLAGPIQRLISFGSIGLLILFLIWEFSISDPLLDLSLFKSRLFFAANLASFFNFVAISGITLLLPFYLQNVRELPPDQVGVIMTVIPLSIFFVAPISGRLSDKYGSRFLSSVGMAIVCSSLFLLALPWNSYIGGLFSSNPVTLVPYLALVGIGIGLFQSPNNNAIMGAVERNRLGVASALLATMRNFGLVTGAAFSTTLLMKCYSTAALVSPKLGPQENFIYSLRMTFLALGFVCFVGVLLSIGRGKQKNESFN